MGCYDSERFWYHENNIYRVQFVYHDFAACHYTSEKSNTQISMISRMKSGALSGQLS